MQGRCVTARCPTHAVGLHHARLPPLATSHRCPAGKYNRIGWVGGHTVRCLSSNDDGAEGSSEGSTESLFQRELRRRGISSIKDANSRPGSDSDAERGSSSRTTTSTSPFDRPRSSSSDGASSSTPQLDRSRALSSEGLEGLIPRATVLVKLGGGFFLAFGPLLLACIVLFGAIYLVLGDQFVHGGKTSISMPSYVDPYELLSEPTVDPTVPLQSYQTYGDSHFYQ